MWGFENNLNEHVEGRTVPDGAAAEKLCERSLRRRAFTLEVGFPRAEQPRWLFDPSVSSRSDWDGNR